MTPRTALAALICALPACAGFPEASWFPSAAYRAGVPRPDLGRAYTPHGALVAYARALAESAKDRVRFETLNVTEEGRVQPLLVITSPANLARLEALKAANGRLADPRTLTPGEADALTAAQPAFVWLGYSVHGYEASGSEASLAVAYHFAASEDPEVLSQLEKVVLLLDLTQNPDGRDRHVQAVGEVIQGANPPDGQDAQNQPRWPGGRFNHRLFDLNRDWAWQTQSESRAKAAAFLAWNPQVAADHHEMEPEASYYFPPTMQPVHEAIPRAFASSWQVAFGRGLARAFDAQGLAYYSKERFDLFYPSYGDSWPSFHGAVGMTFEMASPGGLSYTRRDGENLTLATRIRRHFTASLATVRTAAENRHALLSDYLKARREPVALGDRAGAFLFPADPDPGRAEGMAELPRRNGVEVQRTSEAASTSGLAFLGLGRAPRACPRAATSSPWTSPTLPSPRPCSSARRAWARSPATTSPPGAFPSPGACLSSRPRPGPGCRFRRRPPGRRPPGRRSPGRRSPGRRSPCPRPAGPTFCPRVSTAASAPSPPS
ncbi:MAG: M14 family zinc carboxypeptidase [Holophagaceae bacterium]